MATRKRNSPQKKLGRSPRLVLKSSWLKPLPRNPIKTTAEHANANSQSRRESEHRQPRDHLQLHRVSENNVDLQLPGTNIERFRVPVDDLRYVDAPREASRLSTPAKPAINLEEVRERITSAQQNSALDLTQTILPTIRLPTSLLAKGGIPRSSAQQRQVRPARCRGSSPS
jgi:hypothetical protein